MHGPMGDHVATCYTFLIYFCISLMRLCMHALFPLTLSANHQNCTFLQQSLKSTQKLTNWLKQLHEVARALKILKALLEEYSYVTRITCTKVTTCIAIILYIYITL